MGGDEELGALFHEAIHEDQEAELALRGEGGFGLVEDVEAVAVNATGEKGEKSFAVGLRVERFAAVGMKDAGIGAVEAVDLGGEGVETLGAQKITVGAKAGVAFEDQAFLQILGVGGVGGEPEILAAALGVETPFDGDRLDEGGFARAVLADEKRDFGVQRQPVEVANGGDGKGIVREGGHRLAAESDRADVVGHGRGGRPAGGGG